MKKVLITGGCGFIGSHVAALLLENKFHVIIIDNNENSSSKIISKIKKTAEQKIKNCSDFMSFENCDIRNYDSIKDIFQREILSGSEISWVIHCAGVKSVRESTIFPLKYWEQNVFGAINILKVMKYFNCKNIIFSSSATIYDSSLENLIKEDNAVKTSNPYANTKYTIELILNDIYKSDPGNWRIAALRFFNPIGAHSSGLLGENPSQKPNNIFPIINNVASGNEKILNIFGNDWDTPDGTCIRDYIHIEDIAEGHLKTLEFLNSNQSQIVSFNLGTGIGTSVLKLVKTFEKVNKVKIPFIFSEKRPGDKSICIADNKLMKNVVNWSPKRDLNQMCKDGWRWQCSKHNDLGLIKY